MGDQQAPIGEVFYIEGASSYKYDSVPLKGVTTWCLSIEMAPKKERLIYIYPTGHRIAHLIPFFFLEGGGE